MKIIIDLKNVNTKEQFFRIINNQFNFEIYSSNLDSLNDNLTSISDEIEIIIKNINDAIINLGDYIETFKEMMLEIDEELENIKVTID